MRRATSSSRSRISYFVHSLASKVGWFDLNNINCGLLGMPLGFLVIIVVSLLGKEPSREMQALINRAFDFHVRGRGSRGFCVAASSYSCAYPSGCWFAPVDQS